MLDIQNVSKRYELNRHSTGSLRGDLLDWWRGGNKKVSDRDEFWSLRDVSFSVNQGEVWGIVGSNGAGKSTLLKIISRIVHPTTGSIRGRGSISSLLEVGTGFHQELTGRENIFINGYMLGMRKADILKKFDEIVDFAGVERFLDTPVKRYSSGMYVRLAFAVAAHLEPDILIVDEVLAVGDAAFQKKCLGKMQEVATEKGRTILFVSHNMQAVKQLCTQGLWLNKGKIEERGVITQVVNRYIQSIVQNQWIQEWSDDATAPGNELLRILKVELIPKNTHEEDIVDIRTAFEFRTTFRLVEDDIELNLGLHLYSYAGDCIFDVASEIKTMDSGLITASCQIPGNFLNDGSYYLSLIFVKDTSEQVYYLEECLSFEVADYRGDMKWFGKWMGAVRPQFPFTLKQGG